MGGRGALSPMFPVATQPSPLRLRPLCCNSTFSVATQPYPLQLNLVCCNVDLSVAMLWHLVAISRQVATDKPKLQRIGVSVAMFPSLLRCRALCCNSSLSVAMEGSPLQCKVTLRQRTLPPAVFSFPVAISRSWRRRSGLRGGSRDSVATRADLSQSVETCCKLARSAG